MAFTLLSPEAFQAHGQEATEKSFLQSLEMAELLTKRGFKVQFIGWQVDGDTKISAILYSKPMTGGLMMEINSGPVITDPAYLPDFYQALKAHAKAAGALELRVKPYQTYQTFDSNGQATSAPDNSLIDTLTQLGYQHDGLHTGYPGGEPDWHYVKDLTGLKGDQLANSFSKKGKPLLKKAKSFGTQIRPLKREELQLFKNITAATSDRRQYSDKSLDYYQDFYDSFGDQAEFMVATINFQTYANQLEKGRQDVLADLATVNKQLQDYPDSAKWKKKHQEVSKQLTSFDKRLEEAQAFVTSYQDQDVVVAGALFIYTPQESYYLFSGSYTEFNQFYAPAILQEHAMLKSIQQGIPSYNFLGIMGVFDNSDGVLRFKQNFNGYVTRKTGTFRYYPKPWKHQLIKLVKKLLGR